jgi:hypothetical protein
VSSEGVTGEQQEGEPKTEEHGNEANVLPQRGNAECSTLTMSIIRFLSSTLTRRRT